MKGTARVPECEEVRSRLLAYLGQDVGLDAGEKINLHLQRCPGCLEAYRFWREKVLLVREVLRAWVNENRLPEGAGEEIRMQFFARAQQIVEREAPSRERAEVSAGGRRRRSLVAVLLFVLLFFAAAPLASWLLLRVPVFGPWLREFLSF